MIAIKSFFTSFLDFIFPQKKSVKLLEEMSAKEFKESRESHKDAGNKESQDDENPRGILKYRDPLVREAIWQLKYKGNKKIARLFAEILYEELMGDLEDRALFENFKEPLLLPIPLSAKRRRSRGWNQMELVLDQLLQIDNARPFKIGKNILAKIKETPRQTLLKDRRLRLQNIQGSFAVKDPREVRGRNVILIDDVVTTGSTMKEARKTLTKAGAREVLSIALAH